MIRLARPEDAAAIRSIYAPFVESTPISFEETPPTVSEVATRLEKTLETYPWLVCELEGEVVGYAKAGPLRSMAAYQWTVELSVYVDTAARRSGVASGLYTALLEILSLQGYRSAYAAITVPNPSSDRFHERMGFEAVGDFPRAGHTQGEWRDVRWWYRPVGDPRSDSNPGAGSETGPAPDPPTPLSVLMTDSGRDLERALATGEAVLER